MASATSVVKVVDAQLTPLLTLMPAKGSRERLEIAKGFRWLGGFASWGRKFGPGWPLLTSGAALAEITAFMHAVLESTLVAVWTGDPTLEQMALFGKELEQLAARHPAGIHLFCVVGDATAMPNAAVRELLRQQFETMRGRLLCVAAAMEKSGIAGTLSRAVLSTLLTITRRPFKMTVHMNRRDAAAWRASQPTAPSAGKLLELTAILARRHAA